jgi:hypothetical protein
MSRISGVRKLKQANSVQQPAVNESTIPTYGVEVPDQKELCKVMDKIDTWGVDIFKINDFANLRPLTVVTYSLLKVDKREIKIIKKKNITESQSTENVQYAKQCSDHIFITFRRSLST